jgi:hypothetical protein
LPLFHLLSLEWLCCAFLRPTIGLSFLRAEQVIGCGAPSRSTFRHTSTLSLLCSLHLSASACNCLPSPSCARLSLSAHDVACVNTAESDEEEMSEDVERERASAAFQRIFYTRACVCVYVRA